MVFPSYRLFILAVTAVALLGLWLFLERTNVGLIVRAGTRDPLMVRALGFDLGRIWFLIFGLGVGMAGLAGILAGPLRGVYAEMGFEMIISASWSWSWGHGKPGGGDRGGSPHRRGGQPHHPLLPHGFRVGDLRGDGARPARTPERPLRRARTGRVMRRALAAVTGVIAAHPVLSIVIFFAVLPFIVPYRSLATQVLVYGLFALGFNLLYGYTGILSFGHGLLGVGAYGTGIALAKLGVKSLWLAMLVVFFARDRRGAGGELLPAPPGHLLRHAHPGLRQVFYFAAFHLADLTGGDDGLRGIPRLPLGFFGLEISLAPPIAFHYFALAWAALAVAGLRRILDSPFGAVLTAIRENGDRATACGYDVARIKLLSFVFSALITGLAGSLDALRLTIVPVEALYWSTSGQAVIMTLLGGGGTFFGPSWRGDLPGAGGQAGLFLESGAGPRLIFIFVLFCPADLGTLLAQLPRYRFLHRTPSPGAPGSADPPRIHHQTPWSSVQAAPLGGAARRWDLRTHPAC
jgi:branched-chain amino acid transport system permease protein